METMTAEQLDFPLYMVAIFVMVGILATSALVTFIKHMTQGNRVVFPAALSIFLVWGFVWGLQTQSQRLDDDVRQYALKTWGLEMTVQAAGEVRNEVNNDAVTVPTRRAGELMLVTFVLEREHLMVYTADPGNEVGIKDTSF